MQIKVLDQAFLPKHGFTTFSVGGPSGNGILMSISAPNLGEEIGKAGQILISVKLLGDKFFVKAMKVE